MGMGSKSLCFVFVFVGLSCAVVVPISRGGREHTVIQGLSGNSSDSVIDKLIRVAGNYDRSVGVLGQVENPGAVAKELEEDIEFLKRRVEVERNGTGGGEEDEIRRVLDGLVYFTGFYDGGLRPRGWSGFPTIITVEALVHPWFSFDERRNELRLSVTFTQVWDDERVAFKDRLKTPGGVKEVTLTSHMSHIEIWIPDTYVLNGKGSASRDGVVRVSAEGRVVKEQRMSVAVKCASNEGSFPFGRITCSVQLGSFSWNSSEVTYKWKGKVVKDVDGFEWSGYRVVDVKTFEIEQGSKSGLSLKFHLERGLSRFVYRFYLPLGCLCLVGILGLLRGVRVDGGLVCCAMIGVMNVFMGLSYGWEEMGWRFSRNSMDSYFGFCIFTVFSCFVVNVIRGSGSTLKANGNQETYEMEENNCSGRRNKFSRSNGLFRESGGEVDASRSTDVTRASSIVKSFRVVLGKGLGALGGCCVWMNEFSVVLMVGFFVSWNCVYWGTNLLGR